MHGLSSRCRATPIVFIAPALLLLLLLGCGVLPQAGAPAGLPDGGQVATTASLAGQIVAADGSPAAGARLVIDPGGYEAQADASGAFAFPRLPAGAVVVIGSLDGAVTRSEPLQVEAGEAAEISLRLPAPPLAGALLQVWVRGPDGAPLAGMRVMDGSGVEAWTDDAGGATLWSPGGDNQRLFIEDPHGYFISAELELGVVEPAGGAQWTTALSARPGASARVLGSAACAACHPEQALTWGQSAHAHALDAPVSAALLARFDAGAVVDLGEAQARLERDGEALYLRLTDSVGAEARLRVRGYIGWPERATVPWTEEAGRAYPLPIGWVAANPSRPGYLADGGLLLPYQVERWLDEDGRLRPRSPDQSAEAACLPCHATGFDAVAQADGGVEMTAHRGGGRFMEAGIGCERCHGPGSDHRRAAASAPGSEIVQPGRLDAKRASAVCGQCHANTRAHDSGLPFPVSDETGFQAGDRLEDHAESAGQLWPGGAAADPHMQVEEHAASAHAAAGLGCADCHDPHGGADDSTSTGMLRLSAQDNQLCLSCHGPLDFDDDPAQVRAHAAHIRFEPTGITEAGRCSACHMPGTAAGLWWDARSGAGDLASHRMRALPPAETLAVFDTQTTLPLGAFPAHACGDCHAWNAWRFGLSGVVFPGPDGDPTQRSTHEGHQAAFEELYP